MSEEQVRSDQGNGFRLVIEPGMTVERLGPAGKPVGRHVVKRVVDNEMVEFTEIADDPLRHGGAAVGLFLGRLPSYRVVEES